MATVKKEEQNYGKCASKDCNFEFKENFIVYKCEVCNQYFCYDCFCKKHFEEHEKDEKKFKWVEYEIKGGIPKKCRES